MKLKKPTRYITGLRYVVTGAALMALATTGLFAQADVNQLRQRVSSLEQQLAQARQQLAQAQSGEQQAMQRAEKAEAKLAEAGDPGPSKIEIGPFKIGGAIRANYAIGDYATGAGPTRGAKGGNFGLDTFRINVDMAMDAIVGKLEYRWYNGYNMLHTGWIGYNMADGAQIQVGVNRVPFGSGPYGVSNSWFFDQHYYVGLADDMDTGVKYSKAFGDLKVDLAYYFGDEGNWLGASEDSARYSYDPVVSGGAGYGERHQFNARAIYSIPDSPYPTDIGASLQWGQLDGTAAEDGDHYAASIHMSNSFGAFGLKTQLTYYNYDISDDNAWGNGDLIYMGAFDWADFVASEAFIPAIALSYFIPTDDIPWLDSVTFYGEYSSIIKDGQTLDGQDFNDSEMIVLGAAWARGGWYIYTDWAYSNGNYFVGLDDYTTFGANLNDTWQARFNINFGYYF